MSTATAPPWLALREAIKACHLTYPETADLLGVGLETLRNWCKLSSKRPAPPHIVDYMKFLAVARLAGTPADETATPLLDLLAMPDPPTLPANGLNEAAAAAEKKRIQKIAKVLPMADKQVIDPVFALARRYIALQPPLWTARLLARCRLDRPAAYQWQAGNMTVALLTAAKPPKPGKIAIELVHDVVFAGETWIESPDVTFTFDSAACKSATDDASARLALMDSLDVGGVQDFGTVYGPQIHTVLAAHTIITGIHDAR